MFKINFVIAFFIFIVAYFKISEPQTYEHSRIHDR